MNGWEFLAAYEQLPSEMRQAAVVVMLTTSGDPADRDRAEALGMTGGFSEKPLTKEICHAAYARYRDG